VLTNLLQSITKSFTEKRSTGTPIDTIIKGLKMDIEKYIEKAKESFLPDESTRKTVAASTRQKVDYAQAKKKESGALFLLQELNAIDKERKKYVEKYEGEIKTLRFFLKMAAKLEKASPSELKKLEAELNSLPEMQGNEDLAKMLSAFAKDKEAQTEKAIKYLADLEKSIQDLDERFYGVVDALADAPVPQKIKPTIEKIKGSKDITPQAAFITTHTPTKVENIEVVIVEGQTFDLEEKTNLEPISPAAGKKPREHDSPLLQELASRNKARTGNSTAAVCAEIKTPEVLDFFHAIHAAWGEWTDYKRRERKGTYKSAKSEAATITELANGERNFVIELLPAELNGYSINELGLFTSGGDLVFKRTFNNKPKDSTITFEFNVAQVGLN